MQLSLSSYKTGGIVMVLKINGKDVRVCFGVKFVRELDKKYYAESKTGIKFGIGLETTIPLLLTNDVLTLSEYLYLGTCVEESRPTQDDIDSYIDSADDIEKLFEEVIEGLKQHNATKMKLNEIKEEVKKEKEKIQKKAQETEQQKNPPSNSMKS